MYTRSSIAQSDISVDIRNANIPQGLKERRHWARWFYGKNGKQPANLDGSAMHWKTPANWLDFEPVSRHDKKGIILEPEETGIIPIDIDGCRDKDTGEIHPLILKWIENTYAEISPSETGVKFYVRGVLPTDIKEIDVTDVPWRVSPEQQHVGFEMYNKRHFFTITGNIVPGCPSEISENQGLLNELLVRFAPPPKKKRTSHETKRTYTGNWDFDAWIGQHIDGAESVEDGYIIPCPWMHEHSTPGDTARLWAGPPHTFSCFHAHCKGRVWDDVLEHFDPERFERKRQWQERTETSSDFTPFRAQSSVGNRNGQHGCRTQEPDINFIRDCLAQGEWGDAILFAHLFGGKVIYDHTSSEWYIWDTHHWKIDDCGKIKHYVSGHLASVYIRACAVLNTLSSEQETLALKTSPDEADEESAKAKDRYRALKKQIAALTERAFSLRQVSRNKNVLSFASSQEGMGITSDRWDKNAWVLAFANGVLELQTGTLRDGRPDEYIRTVCPTEWKGIDAPAPRWERFLQEIFEDRSDQERAEILLFLQRILGYGMTGEVREQVFLILFGEDGRNGKDTLQQAISHALGGVSATIMKDVLIAADKGKSAGSATPHLSDLQGKRLAWANEPDRGARFNVGQIKDLSGGGDIPTRGLFEKKITKIPPSHLLILLTNHKPQADADDAAFWDRLRLVTFNMRYVDEPVEPNERKKDPTLWATLKSEASGIVAWQVRGCLDWQKEGLTRPRCVIDDGKNYRDEEDTIHLFLSECCIIKKGVTVKAGTLFDAYVSWAKGSPHTDMLNRTAFGLNLKKKKILKKNTRDGVIYQDIALLTPDGEHFEQDTLEVFTDREDASQAGGENASVLDREQCEQLNHKVLKTDSHEDSKLQLMGTTVHTVHTDTPDVPTEPHTERLHEDVNSLEKPFTDPSHEVKTVHTVHTHIESANKQRQVIEHLRTSYELALKQRDTFVWNVPDSIYPREEVRSRVYARQVEAEITAGELANALHAMRNAIKAGE